MNRNLVTLAGVALALLATSCKEGPTAGEFNVSLTTPNSDDGAIQFVANATAPEVITGVSSACAGCKLFVVKVSDNQYKGVLTGPIVAGTLFRVAVSNTKLTGTYALTIQAVSNRAHATRNSLTGYSVALAP
ncbi:MAG: hypothetical protein EXR93_01050 [Gemmatimonadetes bacterium]|nr:hypothetical protein [Gemmatimonadota bacterium]